MDDPNILGRCEFDNLVSGRIPQFSRYLQARTDGHSFLPCGINHLAEFPILEHYHAFPRLSEPLFKGATREGYEFTAET